MNPDPHQTPSSPDHPAAANGFPAQSPSQTLTPKISRAPRSKIAQLPKPIRDQLNFMLRDTVKTKDILARLGDHARGISVRNLSTWRCSPHYQRWLLEQHWLESLRADQEPAFDLLNDFDAPKFNEAALQLAVTRLFLAFRHADSGDLNLKLGGNAQTFARLVHALARACRETINTQQYRHACAKAFAAQIQQMNTDHEISDHQYQLLVNKMDHVFKMPRRPGFSRQSEPPADLSRPSAASADPSPPPNGSP